MNEMKNDHSLSQQSWDDLDVSLFNILSYFIKTRIWYSNQIFVDKIKHIACHVTENSEN